jgi:phage gpG-like protein
MLSVTADTTAALGARLDALPAQIQAALAAKAASLAQALKAHVTDDKLSGQVLHIRSGALRASIGAEVTVDDDSVQARVFSSGDVKYAAIQEYGGHTAPHDIVPNKAQALAFLVGGRPVFAKIVHHPGSAIPERAYLRSSLADMADEIANGLKSALLEALGA